MFQKLLHLFIPALTPGKFTLAVEHYIQSLGGDHQPRIIEPLHIEVRHQGSPVQLHLRNAYIQYRQHRHARKEIIARYVQALLTLDTDKILPKDIIPIIKDKGFVADTREQLLKNGAEPGAFFVAESYNDELDILYAIDSPSSIRYLTPDALKDLDLQGEPLRSLAIDNLKRILPAIEVHGRPPLLTLKAGSMFESSILLMDRVWNKSELGISGDIVVAIPSREVLLVADAGNAVALSKIRQTATEIAASSAYSLTSKLFIRRDAQFIPLS